MPQVPSTDIAGQLEIFCNSVTQAADSPSGGRPLSANNFGKHNGAPLEPFLLNVFPFVPLAVVFGCMFFAQLVLTPHADADVISAEHIWRYVGGTN